MRIAANIVANISGKVWLGIANFVCVPFYIRFLGIEAYGLVGFFASMLAIFVLLDMGTSTALSRELAQHAVPGARSADSADLLRSLEYIYLATALLIGLAIWAGAPHIARLWLKPVTLSEADTIAAMRLMAVVAVLRWPITLYTAGLVGLQKQVLLNLLSITMTTLQTLGAVVVLWAVAPTIKTFFAWQIITGAIQLSVFPLVLWRQVGRGPARAHFSPRLLKAILPFAAGMFGITAASIVLTQLDKVLLSRYLSLEEFGYYTLAWSIANIFTLAAGALYGALLPALSQLAATGSEAAVAKLYHRGCQLLAILIVPPAITLAVYSRWLLELYVKSVRIAAETHLLLSMLAIGNMLLALMVLPLALQLAYGWTRLSLYKNLIALVFFAPGMVYMASHYGALGAAQVWVMLTAGYVLLEIPVMHMRLLRREKWRWYLQDVGIPALICIVVAGLLRALPPAGSPATWYVAAAVVCAGLGLLLSAAASQESREWVRMHLRDRKAGA